MGWYMDSYEHHALILAIFVLQVLKMAGLGCTGKHYSKKWIGGASHKSVENWQGFNRF